MSVLSKILENVLMKKELVSCCHCIYLKIDELTEMSTYTHSLENVNVQRKT
jgi:hypothetical protein